MDGLTLPGQRGSPSDNKQGRCGEYATCFSSLCLKTQKSPRSTNQQVQVQPLLSVLFFFSFSFWFLWVFFFFFLICISAYVIPKFAVV